MKHFILVATALFTIICTHQTTICTAQDTPARFGIKGGLNYSNLDIRDATNSSWLIGFNLGIFTKLPFTNFIAIQPELYYTSKGSNVTYQNLFVDGTARFNFNYLEVPVLIVLNPISIVNIHFGPYFSYLLNGIVVNTSSTNLFNFENNISADDFSRFDAGGVVGIGIDLGGLSVGARYNFGLTKVGRERSFLGTTYTFPDARNTVLNVYVSISLN
jgi:Outer membrane protein beta-barrel domain